jgi:hypothetical protein
MNCISNCKGKDICSKKVAGGVAEMVKLLFCKCNALSSNSSTAKKKRVIFMRELLKEK